MGATRTNGNDRSNGYNGNGEARYASLATLQATFKGRGFIFKHYPQGKCHEMRWQAGRDVLDCVTMPNGDVLLLEKFELIAWAEDAGTLIEKLAGKD